MVHCVPLTATGVPTHTFILLLPLLPLTTLCVWCYLLVPFLCMEPFLPCHLILCCLPFVPHPPPTCPIITFAYMPARGFPGRRANAQALHTYRTLTYRRDIRRIYYGSRPATFSTPYRAERFQLVALRVTQQRTAYTCAGLRLQHCPVWYAAFKRAGGGSDGFGLLDGRGGSPAAARAYHLIGSLFYYLSQWLPRLIYVLRLPCAWRSSDCYHPHLPPQRHCRTRDDALRTLPPTHHPPTGCGGWVGPLDDSWFCQFQPIIDSALFCFYLVQRSTTVQTSYSVHSVIGLVPWFWMDADYDFGSCVPTFPSRTTRGRRLHAHRG